MSKRREMMEIIRVLEGEGAEVTRSRGGHFKVRNPETGRSINIPATPCNERSVLNAMSRLRRIGLLSTWPRRTSRTTRQVRALAHSR
jgi:predicted RNA binding protein YcfA (HicA-like mRNA interferase family)